MVLTLDLIKQSVWDAKWGDEQAHRDYFTYCQRCRNPFDEGETVRFVDDANRSTRWGMHTHCCDAYLSTLEADAAARITACKGARVGVWYGWDVTEIKRAPSIGHSTGFATSETRPVPADLPDLPNGVFLQDLYHRPMALTSIAFPSLEAAEEWWKIATSKANATYEMHWFDPGQDESSRTFTGGRFGRAQSDAAFREMEAEHRHNP